MFRLNRIVSIVLLSGALSSCTQISPIEETKYVELAQLVQSVECELSRGISKISIRYPNLANVVNNQNVIATFTLKVIETGQGDGNASFVLPISYGTFTFGFDVGLIHKTTRTMDFSIKFKTTDLKICNLNQSEDSSNVVITGNLGLEEWLMNATAILLQTGETPTAVSYSVEFDITNKGSVNPKFEILKSSGAKIGSGVKLSGTQNFVHTLSVTVKEFDSDGSTIGLERAANNFLFRTAIDRIAK